MVIARLRVSGRRDEKHPNRRESCKEMIIVGFAGFLIELPGTVHPKKV
jgi:hypothetical protein